MTSGFVD